MAIYNLSNDFLLNTGLITKIHSRSIGRNVSVETQHNRNTTKKGFAEWEMIMQSWFIGK